MIQVYLGLGGNISNELGDPVSHIQQVYQVIKADERFTDVMLSSLYRSVPFGVTDQPDFINAVLGAKTTLSPFDLLDFCQALENTAGRIRIRHWGERCLDVDILLYGDEVIQSERLTVPHTGLFERNFVLVPLIEIAPQIMVNGEQLSKLSQACDWTGLDLYQS